MDPLTLVATVSAVGPFVISLLKRVFVTHRIMDDGKRSTVNQVLAVAVGIGASIVNAAASQKCPVPPCSINWLQAIIVGFAAGAGAANIRDIDKNFIGISSTLVSMRDHLTGRDGSKD